MSFTPQEYPTEDYNGQNFKRMSIPAGDLPSAASLTHELTGTFHWFNSAQFDPVPDPLSLSNKRRKTPIIDDYMLGQHAAMRRSKTATPRPLVPSLGEDLSNIAQRSLGSFFDESSSSPRPSLDSSTRILTSPYTHEAQPISPRPGSASAVSRPNFNPTFADLAPLQHPASPSIHSPFQQNSQNRRYDTPEHLGWGYPSGDRLRHDSFDSYSYTSDNHVSQQNDHSQSLPSIDIPEDIPSYSHGHRDSINISVDNGHSIMSDMTSPHTEWDYQSEVSFDTHSRENSIMEGDMQGYDSPFHQRSDWSKSAMMDEASALISMAGKRKKIPEVVKRPANAYLLFNQKVRSELLKEQPKQSVAEISKQVSDRWKALPKHEREVYVKMAQDEKEKLAKQCGQFIYKRRSKAQLLESALTSRSKRYDAIKREATHRRDKLGLSRPLSDSQATSSSPMPRRRSLTKGRDPRGRKKKKLRDPTAPKHPLSGYLYFSHAYRESMKDQLAGSTVSTISPLIGEKWRSMSDEEREPWLKMAENDKERYARQMKEHIAVNQSLTNHYDNGEVDNQTIHNILDMLGAPPPTPL